MRHGKGPRGIIGNTINQRAINIQYGKKAIIQQILI